MKFRHFFLAASMAVSMAGMIGCSKSDKTEVVEGEEAAMTVCTVDSVLANPAAMLGDTILVEGYCNHLCAHGGKKAFLLNADSTAMLMCVADSTLDGGAFAPDCPGKMLSVYGVVAANTVTKSQLEAAAAAEAAAAQAQDADGHCDTEARANGTATAWLDSLNNQIAAGGDSVITVSYYIIATSYTVPAE